MRLVGKAPEPARVGQGEEREQGCGQFMLAVYVSKVGSGEVVLQRAGRTAACGEPRLPGGARAQGAGIQRSSGGVRGSLALRVRACGAMLLRGWSRGWKGWAGGGAPLQSRQPARRM